MPNCQNCNYQWSWLETFKMGVKSSKRCSSCQKRQYVSMKSRKGPYFFYMIPLVILLASGPLFDLSVAMYSGLGILLVVFLSVLLPFTIKLSNEQEPLW